MTGFRLLAACSAAALLTACAADDPPTGPTIDRLVTIADGDHLASTYGDGILAPPGNRDLLHTSTLRDGRVTTTGEVAVSNSVTAAPEVLDLTPDGSVAFVAERLGRPAPGVTRAAELPAGDLITAVRLPDSGAPQLLDTARVPSPEALAVSPDGTRLAVVANSAAAELWLLPWAGDAFGDPLRFDLATLGITGTAPGPRGGVTATSVQWRPDGRALAVNITTRNRVAFLAVDGPAVRPLGAPVPTGPDPFVGRFTPDGRHYLTSNWGRNFTAPTLAERLPDRPSTITVIRLADSGAHTVTGTADSGKSAEGLAVSPDGRHVATVNMRGSALPPGVPGHDDSASVSLLRLDDGTLTPVGEYPLDGVLPEGGAFDPSGRYFLATVFQGYRPDRPGPGLQVYEVGDDGLTPVQRIPLPHGVHHVVVR
ncbi:lactonase family protein [Nocardia sp. NPDC057227]|uniref:lactonase family protein n=1 Tax=Nocardia sp. NPDC057227 TaxID=3346056 RepID=UPI00363582BC